MYFGLTQHLKDAGIDPYGFVTGSAAVSESTDGRIRAFCPADAPIAARALSARRAFREAVTRVQPDLISAHFALYAAPWIDQIERIPFVMHFHGPWSAETSAEGTSVSLKQRAQRMVERYVYRRADRCIVLSKAFAHLLHTEYDVPEDRISIVPGGVNANRFDTGHTSNEARTKLGLPQDRSILVSVRRLARRMGLENLIDAVDELRQRDPSILLLIAGKGPLHDELAQRIEDRSLGQYVRLLGFVPDEDLPYLYQAADISVVPTVSLEGFGLITLESLASGTPVLVTPVGGMPEPLRPLSENLVLSGTRVGALVEGIDGALRGSRLLPSAAACVEYVRTHFDWPVIAEQTASVYHDTIRQHQLASAPPR